QEQRYLKLSPFIRELSDLPRDKLLLDYGSAGKMARNAEEKQIRTQTFAEMDFLALIAVDEIRAS
ncbi:MAG TPA: hypothetical protein VGM62_00665, partial [Chthoniobacterales bacterium]